MIRRNLTPPLGVPAAGVPARRAGGPRRNVSYRVQFYRGPAEIDGWVLNISRGGLRAIVEERIELGEELEVCVAEEQLRRPGRVVWTQEEPDGTIVGISFLERMVDPPPGVELESSVEMTPDAELRAEIDAIPEGGDE